VGTWDADYAFINPDGSVRRQRGEVLFGWVMNGYAIQDIFLSYPDSAGGERKMVGGLRYVDPRTDRWTVMFVAPSFNAAIRMEGGAEGDRTSCAAGRTCRAAVVQRHHRGALSGAARLHTTAAGRRMDEEHRMRRRAPARAGWFSRPSCTSTQSRPSASAHALPPDD
jgi:hypothetical protein